MRLGLNEWRKPRPEQISDAMRMRSGHWRTKCFPSELLLSDGNKAFLKLPLCMYSNTMHFSSEQMPTTATSSQRKIISACYDILGPIFCTAEVSQVTACGDCCGIILLAALNSKMKDGAYW